MIYYFLKNSVGMYLTILHNAHQTETDDFNLAYKWTELTKPKNVLAHLSKKMSAKDFKIFSFDTETHNCTVVEINNDFVNKSFLENLSCETEKQLESYTQSINITNMDETYKYYNILICKLQKSLSTVDKEIVDLQHAIEFGKFNCYDAWLAFKSLQNLLQERRKIKNEIKKIGKISFHFQEITKVIHSEQTKHYTPRVIKQLFTV